MLTALSIRDVVLIERLDLRFGPGLTVLTGETGAGKSILLDSLGLALGARAEASLVRAGAAQAVATACFAPPEGHPVWALLAEQGLPAEDEIVLRRVLAADGRSRAFLNDAPVAVGMLRRAGALLVEVQGQHEQMGLANPATHAPLLDAFGVPAAVRAEVGAAWAALADAEAALAAARESVAAARRDEDFLRHAVSELAKLAPRTGEEAALAEERQSLQQGERRAEAIAQALGELAPGTHGLGSRGRQAGPAAALRAAARALARLVPAGAVAEGPEAPVLAAIERAEVALAEAEEMLARLAGEAEGDPRRLEAAEERLFALRAAARKHDVPVADLPALLDKLSARLAMLEDGVAGIAAQEARAASCRAAYTAAAARLTEAREAARLRLERAVMRELAPLRLDRARFVVELAPLPAEAWGPAGVEAVRFLIAANPGQPPAPLGRVASGGELSRLMLALKVVLSGDGSIPTLVFDEVDSGIGGATAAAVGERLARVAERVQVLVVTHSPQVAARGAAHLRVAKRAARSQTVTDVSALGPEARREEIARMLAGETITDAARAAADQLLGTAA
jgi:DNA repair protein RecN (Recombination protein N)